MIVFLLFNSGLESHRSVLCNLYGSSCNYLCFRLILTPLLSFSNFSAAHAAFGVTINRKRKQRSEQIQETIKLHELPYTERKKSRTVRFVLKA